MRNIILIGAFLVFLIQCNWIDKKAFCKEEPTSKVKKIVKSYCDSANGSYSIEIDKCYWELNVYNNSKKIDTSFYHSLFMKVNSKGVSKYKLKLHDKDSMLLYVEYGSSKLADSSFVRVHDYEY